MQVASEEQKRQGKRLGEMEPNGNKSREKGVLSERALVARQSRAGKGAVRSTKKEGGYIEKKAELWLSVGLSPPSPCSARTESRAVSYSPPFPSTGTDRETEQQNRNPNPKTYRARRTRRACRRAGPWSPAGSASPRSPPTAPLRPPAMPSHQPIQNRQQHRPISECAGA